MDACNQPQRADSHDQSIQIIHTQKNDGCQASNAALAQDMSQLSSINQKDINIIFFFWDPSQRLRKKIESMGFEELPQLDEILSKAKLDEFAQEQPEPLLKELFTEFYPVAKEFAGLISDPIVSIQLEKTTTQPCPLFHVDKVALRLICTLRGPGLEWLGNEDVDRRFLRSGSNRNVLKPGATIYQATCYQVCVMKGETYLNDANLGRGVVHRSPPAHGAERWILKMDFK